MAHAMKVRDTQRRRGASQASFTCRLARTTPQRTVHVRHSTLPSLSRNTDLTSSSLQAKADAQVRWAVLNVVTLLRRHEATHDALADAMSRGASVGECIALIERRLAGSSDI